MMILSVISTTYDNIDRLHHTHKLTIPIITIAVITITFVVRGKAETAAGIMASGAGLLAGGGFLFQPPHLAGVSLAYFMYLDLVYASFFFSAAFAGILFLLFLTTQSSYVFLIIPVLTSGIISETAKTPYFDGSITLACVYMAGYFINRFIQQTIQHAKNETARNGKQLFRIKILMDTIKTVAAELTESISTNSVIIDSYTENAETQNFFVKILKRYSALQMN